MLWHDTSGVTPESFWSFHNHCENFWLFRKRENISGLFPPRKEAFNQFNSYDRIGRIHNCTCMVRLHLQSYPSISQRFLKISPMKWGDIHDVGMEFDFYCSKLEGDCINVFWKWRILYRRKQGHWLFGFQSIVFLMWIIFYYMSVISINCKKDYKYSLIGDCSIDLLYNNNNNTNIKKEN